MTEYDSIVAGGGPARFQFAQEVGHRSDYSIAVLERNESVAENDKSTGGTFEQVIEGFDVPDRVIMDSGRAVIFEGPDESGRLEIPNFVLDFPKFLDYLGDDARDNGVEILPETSVSGPITQSDCVTGVKARRRGELTEFSGDIVVDATGLDGTLTTELGMWNRDAAQWGVGREYEIQGEFDCDSMLFKFDHEYAPGGYAWVFPGGENRFKIGVYWVDDFHQRHRPPDGGDIDSHVQRWIDSDDRWNVNRLGVKPRGTRPAPPVEHVHAVHAGQAISDNSVNQRATDGLVAVGDAVSSINPLFEDGIQPGMESAEMAADVVLDALRKGETSRPALSGYEQRWNQEKGVKWKTQRMVGELLYDFDAEQQNEFVQRIGHLSDEQADRLQKYELTISDLLSLYPFKSKDVPKAPTLLRHLW